MITGQVLTKNPTMFFTMMSCTYFLHLQFTDNQVVRIASYYYCLLSVSHILSVSYPAEPSLPAQHHQRCGTDDWST